MISLNKNKTNEKNKNISIDEITDYLFSMDSIKEKTLNNAHVFFKIYSYIIIRFKPRICYIEKYN